MTALDICNRITEINMRHMELAPRLNDGTATDSERREFDRLANEKTRLAMVLKNIIIDESEITRPKLALNLWPESWENLFDCLHHKDTRIHSQGNLWASIQFLEEQAEYRTPERRKALGILEQEEVS